MHRRSFTQWFIGLFTLGKWNRLDASNQLPRFPADQGAVLRRVASIVLPSELGVTGSNKVATSFENYVREYHPGADTEHGYGKIQVRPKPPSPAEIYLAQLKNLSAAVTPESIERMLDLSKTKELPRFPSGKNVIVDLMSFYFRSSDANDLCYELEIGRDKCRGLSGSEKVPATLREHN